MTSEPWISVEQVAQHLGVAKDSVYRWREHRGLPAHRVERLWTFLLPVVGDWVRAGARIKRTAIVQESRQDRHRAAAYPPAAPDCP